MKRYKKYEKTIVSRKADAIKRISGLSIFDLMTDKDLKIS